MLTFKKIGSLPSVNIPSGIGMSDVKYHGSQAPSPVLMQDKIRVYFSARDLENRSLPFYYDLDIDNPLKVIKYYSTQPLFELGSPGEADDAGIMISQAILSDVNTVGQLNYTGWNVSFGKCRFRTTCMYAQWNEKTWNRYYAFDRATEDPCGVSMQTFLKENFYMSIFKWEEGEPYYQINSIYFDYNGETERYPILKLNDNEGGLARPIEFWLDKNMYLFYCRRGKKTYRTDFNETYKFGLAKYDNRQWKRIDDQIELLNESGFMQAYPYPLRVKDKVYLFYNNHFTSHICIAELIDVR